MSSFRSRHRRCSLRKGVLRNFTKFTRKHLCQSLFLNKVAGLRPAVLFQKRLWHRCFPVSFVKFLRTPFLQNSSGRLFLKLKFGKFLENSRSSFKSATGITRLSYEENHIFSSYQHYKYKLFITARINFHKSMKEILRFNI